MNPDKLFDYLEGRLPAAERAALEQRLISDKQLQRELAVARQIHAGMRGDSREVLLPPTPEVTEQGRKMALRVGCSVYRSHGCQRRNRSLVNRETRNKEPESGAA